MQDLINKHIASAVAANERLKKAAAAALVSIENAVKAFSEEMLSADADLASMMQARGDAFAKAMADAQTALHGDGELRY